MSFAFRPEDSGVEAALHRIARAELAAARKILRGAGSGSDSDPGLRPQAVHGLRRHTKKLRGLLRLVRPVFPGFARANAVLRDGARHLAELRDAEVRLATLQGLAAALPAGTVPDYAAPQLLAAVTALRQPEPMARLCAALEADLSGLRGQVGGWRLTARGWAALEPGLCDTWRAARRGHKAATRARALGAGSAPFHDWRKAVKHHWYQARLLEPIWPQMLAPQIAAVDALGEDLGAHNDIDLLLAHLAGHADRRLAGLAAEGPFLRAARAARDDLARRSLEQGARLLAEPPGALAARWGAWWQVWRASA